MAKEKKQILIVEDAPEIRKIIEYALLSDDHELYIVDNGLKALEQLTTITPDLILLDIIMPGMNGLEVLRRIKENPATAQIGVLVCSGESDRREIDLAIRLGAAGYIAKPFDMISLADRVSRYFSTIR